MSSEWAAMDEQPILLTSTNPCITRAAGTQGVNLNLHRFCTKWVMAGKGGRGGGDGCHIVIQNIVPAVGDGREGVGGGSEEEV
jgi:hypothetical protein